MFSFILPMLIGVICIILGISNMKGNISSLHSYHRNRVSEEDRIPFGRKVGLGTIIVGIGIIIFGIFGIFSLILVLEALVLIGTALMIAALILGLCISFAAMIKYNHGIFTF